MRSFRVSLYSRYLLKLQVSENSPGTSLVLIKSMYVEHLAKEPKVEKMRKRSVVSIG